MGSNLHRRAIVVIAEILCLLVLTACNDNSGMQPASGGKPYEVLVLGTDTAAVNTVRDALTALTETALPQQEPSFDVSVAYGEIDASTICPQHRSGHSRLHTVHAAVCPL